MTHVLIIEDDRDQLELMAYLLRAFGFKPCSIESAEAALGVLQDRATVPDLIICDLQLPRMSGLDFARALNQYPVWAKIPLVATSATSLERDKVLAAGFDGFIPKPIVPETFAAEISAFLTLDQRPPEPAGVAAPNHHAADKTSQRAADGNRGTILTVDAGP